MWVVCLKSPYIYIYNSCVSPLAISLNVKYKILPLTYKFLYDFVIPSQHTPMYSHIHTYFLMTYSTHTGLLNTSCSLPTWSLCTWCFLCPEHFSSKHACSSLPKPFDLYKVTLVVSIFFIHCGFQCRPLTLPFLPSCFIFLPYCCRKDPPPHFRVPKSRLLSNTQKRMVQGDLCWQSKRFYWERAPGWRAGG